MRKIILDCDPGHDDAIAILLAGKSKQFELLGLTIECGNQTLEKTARNAFNICAYLDIDTPIALGPGRPIIKDVEVCEAIHGESGLDGFDFPEYKYAFSEQNAINFLINQCKLHKNVTIVTTGPMTNLALAMRIEPSIINNIEEVICMGGSIGNGNVSPAAEFNILCDPEATHIVFTSGVKVKMIGLDVTRKVLCYDSLIERAKEINTKSAYIFSELMKAFNKTQKEVFGFVGAPLHDPATIVSLLNEDVVTFKKINVEVDLSHGSSYGRTNCDIFDYLKKEKNVFVAVDINVDLYWDTIFDILRIE